MSSLVDTIEGIYRLFILMVAIDLLSTPIVFKINVSLNNPYYRFQKKLGLLKSVIFKTGIILFAYAILQVFPLNIGDGVWIISVYFIFFILFWIEFAKSRIQKPISNKKVSKN